MLVFVAWFCDIRKKSAKIKSAYKQDYVHCTGDVDFDFAGPAIQASVVAGYVLHVVYRTFSLALYLQSEWWSLVR